MAGIANCSVVDNNIVTRSSEEYPGKLRSDCLGEMPDLNAFAAGTAQASGAFAAAAAAAGSTAEVPKKRSLDDVMGARLQCDRVLPFLR